MSDLKVGSVSSNFEVLSIRSMDEYEATGLFLRHRTGCLLYHLRVEDEENLFSFAFRTPPKNSRGAAHIIEHSVLAGSRSFPVKDPFLQLLKGSVNTFLNAMTYPDKTVYPASSTLEKDYFNLMRVYGDAVFFPLLRKEIFHQEGRRFELTNEGKLQLGGVVYNEMLGNYSEQDSIVGEWSYRALFPESVYRFDSGGEPEEIPALEYSEFKAFHESYYHPSNCLVFLYGNIPTERQLAFIDEHFLSSFQPAKSSIEILPQSRWREPRTITIPSPIGEGEDPSRKTSITMSWLGRSVIDPKEVLTMEVLSEMLIGNAGAPLHKAIVESGIGDDLSPQSGLETDVKEMVFTIGVRGTDPGRQGDLERLVMSELEKLVREGIPSDVMRGALKRVEFRNREIPGGIPFGLRLMGKTLRGWLHGTSPETTLEFARWMSEVNQEAKTGHYFEEVIRTSLLENPHRATVIVSPDPALTSKKQAALGAFLEEKLDRMSEGERDELRRDTESLRRFHDEPDTEAAAIPTISLSDIPREVDHIETTRSELSNVPLYVNELFTNGIAYVDLAFSLEGLVGDRLQYLPLFSRAICGLGFPGVPYDEVARQLALKTGGIFSFLEAGGRPLEKDRAGSYLYFRLKVLDSEVKDGVDMLMNMVRNADFDDTRRIHDLLFEMRNDFKSSILPRGNSYAALRAASRLSGVVAREEQWSGASQLLFLEAVTRSTNSETELSRIFKQLRDTLFVRSGLTVNVGADGRVIDGVVAETGRLVRELPLGAFEAKQNGAARAFGSSISGIESFSVPSDVGYAATALRAATMEDRSHGHEVLLAHLLRTDYLWEKIRMRGGAYGAFAGANGTEGLFSFSSYRDPDISTSLGVFRESLSVHAKQEVPADVLTKAIIGSVGRELRPMAPGEKTLVALRRTLYGISDEMRQAKRDVMLAARPEDIARSAARLLERYDGAASAVLAGPEMIKEARKQLPAIEEPVQLPL